MAYPFPIIWINGRKILLRDVIEEKVSPDSDFENETFSFIRAWLSEKDTFELQTSGSTGAPKVIKVTRSMMKTSAQLTERALNLQQGYSALVCLNTKFIAGKMMLVRCLEAGMQIFAVDPCANPFSKIPVDQTIHFAALVPYQAKSVLESKHPHLLDGLLTCILGGAPVEETLIEDLQRFSCNLYSTYGMTETVSHIALRKLNGAERSIFFETLPGITIRKDERNCLIIKAPYLADEIHTNDIIEMGDDRRFKWLGRYDNVINSGGVKISPESLEEKISQIFTQLHISNRFFIFGLPDPNLHQKIVLVIEGEIPMSTILQIENHFLHTFSSYEKPKEIFQSPRFILSETSKILRQETMKIAIPTKIK